jgi:drug/metabolite transporter (DMT)-like permease
MSRTPFFIALLSAMLFGAATPLSKPLLGELSSLQLAGFLYLGAAIGVLPLLYHERQFKLPTHMDRRTLLRLAGAILFGGILGPVLLLSGLRLVDAASVSLWLNLELVFTVLLGALIFRDHLGKRGWLGAGLTLFASLMLSYQSGAAGWLAIALVALACLCWGLDNHLTALIDGITPALSTFWKGLIAGLTSLTLGLLTAPLQAGGTTLLQALVIGVFSYGASLVLYISAAQRLGATRSQLVFASAPLYGLFLAVFFLGEAFTFQLALAGILAFSGVLFLSREEHEHAHLHEPLYHEHWHAHGDDHHDHTHPQEVAAGIMHLHNHPHQHPPIQHRHPHWPDIHHRHESQEQNRA